MSVSEGENSDLKLQKQTQLKTTDCFEIELLIALYHKQTHLPRKQLAADIAQMLRVLQDWLWALNTRNRFTSQMLNRTFFLSKVSSFVGTKKPHNDGDLCNFAV